MTAPPTILLAEPDEALAASLRFTLELQGHRVTLLSTADLPQACRELSGPTCLVLGERPRSTEMLDLAAYLSHASSLIAVIVLTTYPSRATRKRAHRCGVTLIEKPLLGETLNEALRASFAAEI